MKRVGSEVSKGMAVPSLFFHGDPPSSPMGDVGYGATILYVFVRCYRDDGLMLLLVVFLETTSETHVLDAYDHRNSKLQTVVCWSDKRTALFPSEPCLLARLSCSWTRLSNGATARSSLCRCHVPAHFKPGACKVSAASAQISCHLCGAWLAVHLLPYKNTFLNSYTS